MRLVQWDRVTFSRLTKIYFIFSVLHCIVQVVFQVQAFVANADAAKFLGGLIVEGNATDPGFAVYGTDLRMCDKVPNSLDASSCTVVWDGHTMATSLPDTDNYAANASISSSGAVASATTSILSSATSFSSATSLASAAASSSSAPSSSVVSSTTVSSASTVRSSSAASGSSKPVRVITVTKSIIETTATGALSTLTITAAPTATPKVDIQDASDSESDDESDDESDIGEESDDEEEDAATPHKRDIVLPETKIRLALNGTSRVNLQGLGGKFEVDLPRKCLYALNWPVDRYVASLRV